LNYDLNAADVAAALQGKIAGVTSLMPIGPNHLLYAIDPSKVTGPPAPGKNTISFHMQATDANGQIALASISLAVLPKASPPAIITPVLPAAIVNAAYKEKLLAVHIPGVKWKLKEVPVNEPGLKVDPNDGTVHFTPSQAGTIQFTVEAQGAAGGKSVSQEITVDVLDQSAGLRITSSQLQDAIAGVPYTASVEAIGGAGKVTWSSPDKPAGVVVDPAGNVIIVKPSPQAAPAAKVTAASVEAQLLELLGELPPVPLSPPEVLNLSNGSVGACAIITMIGHQVDGVVELPILDGLAFGARRKPEVIYNQSIIFLEASIMPTAADLGQGLVFPYDRIELGAYSGRAQHVREKAEPCGETVEQERNKLCIEAHNEADFLHDKLPYESVINAIFDYHKRMIAYFAGEYIDSTGVVQHQAGVSLPESLGQDVSSDAQ
jgi:hypothetical protein